MLHKSGSIFELYTHTHPITASPQICVQNPNMCAKEKEKMINEIKLGKAPGPSVLPQGFLRNRINWWAPILVEAFMKTNESGKIPAR